MTDWTTARVVRDRDGDLWFRDRDAWMNRWRDYLGADIWLDEDRGPLVPVLDADGLPVVRTVGDLTARHIGRRVRVGGADPAVLHSLSVRSGRYVPEVIISTGLSGGFYITLDTPCELLPEGDA